MLLPPQVMVDYDVPDSVTSRTLRIDELPADWPTNQTHTQALGNSWLDSAEEVLLIVPSIIVPIALAPDRNVLINHRTSDATLIKIADITPFTLDPRLFHP